MSDSVWYSWECPVCGAVSTRIVRRKSSCRRYGLTHLLNFHKRKDLEPVIKKITKSDKTTSKIESLPTDVWIEILEPPPGVKHTDLLIIPGHLFVKKHVFQEIMKKIRGEK